MKQRTCFSFFFVHSFFKSFYCYWRCWYFYCFAFSQKTHNKSIVTHLHNTSMDELLYDAQFSIVTLNVGSLCLIYTIQTKQKVLHFNGNNRTSKHPLVEEEETQTEKNRNIRTNLHMAVICWGVFKNSLLSLIQSIYMLIPFKNVI